MGWWKTGKGDDVLGDGPADRLEEALRIFAAGGTKPTFQHFLDSAAAALRFDAGLILGDPSSIDDLQLVARFKTSSEVTSGGEPEDVELRERVSGAFIEIADEYEGGVGRKPHLSEILGTIAFSLGVRPERFFAMPEGQSVAEVVATKTGAPQT